MQDEKDEKDDERLTKQRKLDTAERGALTFKTSNKKKYQKTKLRQTRKPKG